MMKKKILLILTILLIIPVMVLAENNYTNLEINGPVIGEHPDFLENDDNITVVEQKWTNRTDDVEMTENDTFEENKKYYYSVTYDMKESKPYQFENFSNNRYHKKTDGTCGAKGMPSNRCIYKTLFFTGDTNPLLVKNGDIVITNKIIPYANSKIQDLDISYKSSITGTEGYWTDETGKTIRSLAMGGNR